MLSISKALTLSGYIAKLGIPRVSFVHTSAPSLAGQSWRMRHGQSRSGTEYGPLTDLPDWSFADGTQAPLGKGQKKRRKRQAAIGNRVKRLVQEMKTAETKTDENPPAT